MTSTSSVGPVYGGTGTTTWSALAIPYISSANQFGEILQGSPNQVLIFNGAGTGYTWVSTSTWDTDTDTTISLGAEYSPTQTGLLQVLATSTAGTDFYIASVGDTHTFYLPDAAAGARGLFTATDWGTFNSKWDAISEIGLTAGYFMVGDAAGAAEATSSLFIDPTGYFGIGTSGPWQQLSVNGYGAFESGLCIGGSCITDWSRAESSSRPIPVTSLW